MDKVINIKVRNRIAVADQNDHIVCGNEDYTAVFDFDDEWRGIDVKTARFYRGGIYTDTVFTGDTVAIPEMSRVSYVEIGVFAGDITTTPAVVRCYRSILCNGGNVAEPKDDVYAQIIDLINSIEGGGGGGAAGADGEDGGYYIPVVTDAGELSWTPTDPKMPTIPSVNIKGPGGEAGVSGKNGVGIESITTRDSSVTGDGTQIVIALTDGTSEHFKIESGVGIDSIDTTESTAAGGVNRVKIILTDGTSYTLNVRNGRDGSRGATGGTGPAGADGVSPTVSVEQITGGNRIAITDVNGKKTFDVMNGSVGKDGAAGTSVTVKSVSESTVDGGDNVITFSDGKTVAVKNGSKGSKGDTGGVGPAGSDGVGIKSVVQTATSSADGGSNIITVTKTDGTTSTFTVKNGSKGSKGDTGPAGYTPIKGVDYFTDADQEIIVQQVIAALGTPVFGTVDENNNIILTGELAEGTYTIKYETGDGEVIDIGAMDIGGTPAYTNVLDTVGFVENKRISASSGYSEKDNTGTDLTGYIAVKTGDVIRLKNVTMPQTSTDYDNQLYYYDSGKSGKGSTSLAPPNYDSVADGAGNIIQFKVGSAWTPGGTGFIRIGAANIDSASIITINEVIE